MSLVYKFDALRSSGAYIYQTVSRRRLSDVCHSHDFYEWIVISGGWCVQRINGREQAMSKDDVLLLLPGDTHVFVSQSEDVRVLCLSVRREEQERLSRVYDFAPRQGAVFSGAQACERLSALCPDRGGVLNERECRFLLTVLFKLHEEAFGECEERLPQWFVRLEEGMKKSDNLKEGLGALLRLSGYSHSRLSVLMKARGLTPHGYLMEARLAEAHRLLTLTGADIGEIAESVGYMSVSHFQKIFLRRYGITPARLRKNRGVWTI